MPSPFPCSPVIRECSWKKTPIKKKKDMYLSDDNLGDDEENITEPKKRESKNY